MSRVAPRWDRDIIVANQVLPEDFAVTLRWMHASTDSRLDGTLRLAIDEGWTAAAIARAMGITRERVLQRAVNAQAQPWGVDIPPPPRRESPPPRPARPELPDEVVSRLREMCAIARSVNGSTHRDDPRRKVSVEFSAELARLVDEGWPVKYLADRIGVTHAALRFRLGRHGYMKPSPSVAHQQYRGDTSNYRRGRDDSCRDGHPLTDAYLSRRGFLRCRTCTLRDRRRQYLRRRQLKRGTA